MHSYLIVFLGGGLGSLSRYFVYEWLSTGFGYAPWISTWSVNVVGSFIIGILAAFNHTFMHAHTRWIWLLLITGFLGGFTTFSSFSLDGLRMAQAQQWPLMALYSMGSILSGLLAALLGWLLGQWIVHQTVT